MSSPRPLASERENGQAKKTSFCPVTLVLSEGLDVGGQSLQNTLVRYIGQHLKVSAREGSFKCNLVTLDRFTWPVVDIDHQDNNRLWNRLS